MYTLYIYRIRRTAAALCLGTLLLTLTGCKGSILSNYKEVDTLQLVQTLGVDCGANALRVTVSTGAGTDSLPSVVLSRECESLSTAMESLQNYSSKEELYYSHTRYALLGENGARAHFREFLDYVERNTKLRMDVIPFIVRAGDAKELITLSGKESYEITETLSSIERDVKHSGTAYPYSCREVARSLSEYGGALVCAVAGKATADSVFTDSGELVAIPAGYAVIRDGTLADFLGLDASRGADIIMNKYGYGAIELFLSNGVCVTVLADSSSCDISAGFDEKGRLSSVTAQVKLSAGLSEMNRPIDAFDPAEAQRLNAALSKKVEDWCSLALRSSVSNECDFMGLYGRLRQKYPREISALQDSFPQALAGAKLSVKADCTVKHSYNLERPLEVKGEERENGKQ